MTDRNEALRLAEILEGGSPQFNHEAAALLRQQAERIAELEAELLKRHQRLHDTEELAGQYLAQRDDATAERDQLKTDLHIATDDAAQMLASTQSLRSERDQLRAEVERLREAISMFCAAHKWAVAAWKAQPAIATLFEIDADRTKGEAA